MFRNKKFGFIGSGQMGQAIFRGMISSGEIAAENILVTDIDADKLKMLERDLGVKTFINDDNAGGAAKILEQSDVVVLAIKPQFATKVLAGISHMAKSEQLIISIMGGIPLSFLESYFKNSPVIRVMPNTPLMVRKGVAGLAMGNKVTKYYYDLGMSMFELVGASYALTENMLDSFTGVCGCSPAYAYMFIEALAMGGIEKGLPAQMAMKMAAQALAGSAEMVIQTGTYPGQLMSNVCTPGGSTIVGVHVLEENSFKGIVMNAVCKSCDSMISIGEKIQ